jgi:hypothetical protein
LSAAAEVKKRNNRAKAPRRKGFFFSPSPPRWTKRKKRNNSRKAANQERRKGLLSIPLCVFASLRAKKLLFRRGGRKKKIISQSLPLAGRPKRTDFYSPLRLVRRGGRKEKKEITRAKAPSRKGILFAAWRPVCRPAGFARKKKPPRRTRRFFVFSQG